VVKGEVAPDHFVVDKGSLEILNKTIAPKTVCYQRGRDQIIRTEPPIEKQDQACLNHEELMELSRLGKIAEAHYQLAQDIEWAIDADLSFPENIFLVQARPVTGADKSKKTNTDIIIDMMSSLFRR